MLLIEWLLVWEVAVRLEVLNKIEDMGTIEPIDYYYLLTNNTERFTLNGTTGAATFAGTITAPSYAIYGGLGTQFLKLMVHQIQHLTQHLQN
jgi:hypothetical protein